MLLGSRFAKHIDKRCMSGFALRSKSKKWKRVAVSPVLTPACIDILVVHVFFKKSRQSPLSGLVSTFACIWDVNWNNARLMLLSSLTKLRTWSVAISAHPWPTLRLPKWLNWESNLMVLQCCLDVRHYIFCGAEAPVACFLAHSASSNRVGC